MTRRVENALLLSGADCALLYQAARLRDLRVQARGSSERLYGLLTDITTAAFAHADSLRGTRATEQTEPDDAESTGIVTVANIARRAGLTPRAVRNHIGRGLLHAEQQGRTWIITTEAAEQYIAGRKTA